MSSRSSSTLPLTTRDLTGRTVIVTGSNVGLGYEAAKHFYAMKPARLILAVRSVSKGEEARKSIVESKGGGDNEEETVVEVWELDLASFENTKLFAKRVEQELERLDILLLNAAVATRQWTSTDDGWEISLQTNVLSTFLLAALLTPLIKKTASLPPLASPPLKPHLVIVASDIHARAKFPERTSPQILKALNDSTRFLASDRYETTKLLDIFLTRQLGQANEFKDGSVIVCSVNPSFCRSELMREWDWNTRQSMYNSFARTTEEGSRTYLWACLTEDIPLGAYSSSCAVERPAAFVESREGRAVQRKLWDEVADVLVTLAPETDAIWKCDA